ncbi:MAG: DHH family phosphoesterase [Lachnospiraceae bacterium]|nr:DHH family phosphoesterase [Lachnospiraceae bacterium]
MKRPIYYQWHCLLFSAVMLVMAALSYRYDHYVFIFEIIVAVISSGIIMFGSLRYRRYVNKVVRGAVNGIKGVNHNYLERFSVPVIVTGSKGDILWCNSKFRKKLSANRECVGESVYKYIPGTNLDILTDSSGIDVEYGGRRYTVLASAINNGAVLYYIDDTEFKITSQLYSDSRPVVATVLLDNRDEFERNISDESFSHAIVLLESVLQKWASSCSGLYVKASGRRYKIVMDEKALCHEIENKFKILEEVRAIKVFDESIVTTISMGIGRGGATVSECEQWSLQALDLALGRGGDQVSIKQEDEYEFFGGVSKGIEKHEKVKARVIAKALTEKIRQSDNVLVMGHQSSDLDAVGAAVGMWSVISKTFDNRVNIVVDKSMSTAESLIDNFIQHGYKNIFILPQDARKIVNEKTLLIIVDTHSPTFVEDTELYKMCQNVVVIDHHRMMVNRIANACVFFHEPFASSASEMVTELVQYISDDALNKHEAEALLSGIMLDTKNFVLRTGVRTFEAAAYLRRKGADTVEVKRLFSDSLDTYKAKTQLVSDAEIYSNSAIACTDDKMNTDKNIRVTAAQAADELLSIQDVQASYVLYRVGEDMNVSARSLGDVNVQLVMEHLGGGGHQTMAGANLGKISRAEATQKLVEAINTTADEMSFDAVPIKRRNI